MNLTMKKTWWAGCALAGLTCLAVDVADAANAAGAAEPSLCTRLAEAARRAPAATWARPDPLAAWFKPSRGAAADGSSATARQLAADIRWRERIDAQPGQQVDVDHLPGTPVYLVEQFGGTANCQSLVLVEAPTGQPARELAPPFSLDGKSLCVTTYVQLAQVMGQPALTVGGATSMAGPDLRYRIAPWTGQGWGPSCTVDLHLRSTLLPGRRFCAPGAAVCEAGQPVAEQLAAAYEADRRSKSSPLDAARFTAGHTPDPAVAAALNPPAADEGAVGDFNLRLPMFGADDSRRDPMQTQFSNANPRRLPVFIDGRWWLAVVGRGGVGWREGDTILVALFAPPGRPGDAVASYQFVTGSAGLVRAAARDERP